MDKKLPPQFTERMYDHIGQALNWLEANVFTSETIIQLVICAITISLAFIISKPLEKKANTYLSFHWLSPERHQAVKQNLTSLVFPAVWLMVQSFALALMQKIGWSVQVMDVVLVLLSAWIIIRLSTSFVSSPFWSKLIALTAWGLAALSILGLLTPTIVFLDNLAFSLGSMHISALGVLKAIVLLSLLLWLAVITSRTMERRIRRSRTLTPSMQELSSKLLKVSLIGIAILVSLTSVGIDLTAFAVFSGAVGVGIGFGLQKVVSNLISGIILLLDRSIKPGDVIELGDTYGWINTLGARFVSVITRDGKEHLIPNEDLITQKVVNWSYSDTNVRIKVPVGISYDSDVNLAMTLLVEAAMETPRVLESPAPRCLLMGFGDNSISLELRIWASDPNNGVANLKSAVMLKVWNKFHESGISFPYPQRDVHMDIGSNTIAALSKALSAVQKKEHTSPPAARPKPKRTT